MNWSVHLDEVNNMLVLTYVGCNTSRDVLDSSYEIIRMAKEKEIFKYLVDVQDLIADFKANELFVLPFELYEKWGMDISTRIALLQATDPKAQRMVSFYEIACQNLGWQAKVFPNQKSALKWLNS